MTHFQTARREFEKELQHRPKTSAGPALQLSNLSKEGRRELEILRLNAKMRSISRATEEWEKLLMVAAAYFSLGELEAFWEHLFTDGKPREVVLVSSPQQGTSRAGSPGTVNIKQQRSVVESFSSNLFLTEPSLDLHQSSSSSPGTDTRQQRESISALHVLKAENPTVSFSDILHRLKQIMLSISMKDKHGSKKFGILYHMQLFAELAENEENLYELRTMLDMIHRTKHRVSLDTVNASTPVKKQSLCIWGQLVLIMYLLCEGRTLDIPEMVFSIERGSVRSKHDSGMKAFTVFLQPTP